MAQYDQIADEYVASKTDSIYRECIEYYTFVHRLLLPVLGIEDNTKINLKKILANYRVLDLACGQGYLTRKLCEDFGCKDIVGFDISSNMIDTARAREEIEPLGIIYNVSDVLYLSQPEKKFDFVVAFYLLNYAKTNDELDRMVQIIGEQLKDGDKGYFLSITGNVCADEKIFHSDRYLKYGYRCEVQLPLVDGARIKNIHFNSDGSSFSYTTYYFSPKIYKKAFEKAGFKSFKWVPMESACDAPKHDVLIEYPATIGIIAHK
ncbi:unnamed protein product [Adineta steineri]|uniref:Methyltransferase domain-containing protein n=1 Tax=Adineta steineri TaxID=433720 RepID=A0A819NQE5_9BILA|nr:unnamed protein product [Adineta steineri]CAF0859141.1 unnamed protein product [Adineta steineri]CAF0951687.1 unnamed protein product [Adineta steineri]CAF3817417.1 unnamed protein product [Adineta steineri]CAF4001571.1 unnamed protein product [Adineta steineri]